MKIDVDCAQKWEIISFWLSCVLSHSCQDLGHSATFLHSPFCTPPLFSESVSYDDKPCPMGHYCPLATRSMFQFPCPTGTFLNATLATAQSDCLGCPGGWYCELEGQANPKAMCSPGKGYRQYL